jgi:ABC-type sugar transport system substrate-binding protein
VLPDPAAKPWAELVVGAQQEAAAAGAELALAAGPVAGRPGPPGQQLQTLVERRVDLVLIAGGGEALEAVLRAVEDRGVPLAGLDSQVSVERLLFRAGPDRQALGRLQAECLSLTINGPGSILLLATNWNSPASLEWARGFQSALERQRPQPRLVVERAGRLEPAGAAQLIDQALERWPDLKGLAVEGELAARGALEALRARDQVGRVRLASANVGPLADPALGDGTLACDVADQHEATARAAVRNALAYLNGRPFARNLELPPLVRTGAVGPLEPVGFQPFQPVEGGRP